MNRLPFNCIKDKRGYIIPKCPIIRNTPDIIEWLRTENKVRMLFNDIHKSEVLNKEWLEIGIGCSDAGYIYAFASTWTNDEFRKYFFIDNPYAKVFKEDYEGFKKYMHWISNLKPKFIKQNFIKNH